MKTKKIIVFILAGTTALALLSGCSQQSSSDNSSDSEPEAIEEKEAEIEIDPSSGIQFVAPEKSETVTAKADASGTVEEISAAVTLSGYESSDGDFIKDTSNLTDIKNKEGAEEFVQEGDTVYWQNLGEDISYEGESDGKIPLKVTVTYYLDGEEINPSEIAGKSGDFKIRFDFEQDSEGDYIPFLTVPAVMMSGSNFSDVDVSSGKVMNMSDNLVAVGYCVPGLSDYLSLNDYEMFDDTDIEMDDSIEITGHTDDFELDMTAVIIKNGLFGDLEDEDLDNLSDLADGFEDLADAGDDLSSAAVELVSGSAEFETYLTQYVDGVKSMADGISQLDSSLAGMDTAAITAQLQAAMAAEQAAVEEAGGTYDPSTSQYAQLLTLVQGFDQVKSGVSQLNAGASQLASSGDSLVSGYQNMESGIYQFSAAIQKFNSDGLNKMSDKGDEINSLLDKIRTLRDNDNTCINFSGCDPSEDTDVTFIVECDAIEK